MAEAGNHGEKVRSDCYVRLELSVSGGLQIHLTSKVVALYGESIRSLCLEVLEFFGVGNAVLTVEDQGALPWVIAARIESAVKQLVETTKEFLPGILPDNPAVTARDRHRLTRLYLPGNTPSLMINAGIHQPDAIILDLEDSVGPAMKRDARFLVRNALRSVDFMGAERMVRINQMPAGLDDLDFVIPHGVNLILVPKCESAGHIWQVNERIDELKNRTGSTNPVWLMPIIESALGVVKAYEIASAADNVVALAIGLEDYTADIGARRTEAGNESLFARCQVLNAAKAAGIQAIDSVFSDIGDLDALRVNVACSKALGFDGMGCIHPRQISVIREGFLPDDAEIETAKKIAQAFWAAAEQGSGVTVLGHKMIDAPVAKRALRIIELAISTGKLDAGWRESTT